MLEDSVTTPKVHRRFSGTWSFAIEVYQQRHTLPAPCEFQCTSGRQRARREREQEEEKEEEQEQEEQEQEQRERVRMCTCG
jgi:hypothetical protein